MAHIQEAESLFLQGEFQRSFDALQELTQEKSQGRAQYLLGLFYFYGILVPEDNDMFSDYLDKAWEDKELLSFMCIIYMRDDSKERTQAYRELMKLLREQAKEEDPWAMHQIGLMYEKGLGIHEDMEKALTWYEKAANIGLVMAMADAGKLYFSEGQPFYDPKKGFYWYLKGAALGYHVAEVRLADCYYCGMGVEEDPEKAEVCFKRAADHGDLEA